MEGGRERRGRAPTTPPGVGAGAWCNGSFSPPTALSLPKRPLRDLWKLVTFQREIFAALSQLTRVSRKTFRTNRIGGEEVPESSCFVCRPFSRVCVFPLLCERVAHFQIGPSPADSAGGPTGSRDGVVLVTPSRSAGGPLGRGEGHFSERSLLVFFDRFWRVRHGDSAEGSPSPLPPLPLALSLRSSVRTDGVSLGC